MLPDDTLIEKGNAELERARAALSAAYVDVELAKSRLRRAVDEIVCAEVEYDGKVALFESLGDEIVFWDRCLGEKEPGKSCTTFFIASCSPTTVRHRQILRTNNYREGDANLRNSTRP